MTFRSRNIDAKQQRAHIIGERIQFFGTNMQKRRRSFVDARVPAARFREDYVPWTIFLVACDRYSHALSCFNGANNNRSNVWRKCNENSGESNSRSTNTILLSGELIDGTMQFCECGDASRQVNVALFAKLVVVHFLRGYRLGSCQLCVDSRRPVRSARLAPLPVP